MKDAAEKVITGGSEFVDNVAKKITVSDENYKKAESGVKQTLTDVANLFDG